jgi:hypothetical protein
VGELNTFLNDDKYFFRAKIAFDCILQRISAQDKSGSIMDWIGGWFMSKTLWWSAFGVVALFILYKKYSPMKPQWLSIKGSKG